MQLRIATRQSALALWQARHVAERLQATLPDAAVELVPMTTRGDEMLDRSLAAIGGKGLFLKELEQAMLEGRADLAVHSMKDVPYALPDGFEIAAILERANPFDALVGVPDLAALTDGARVGTSSLRRRGQLLALRPDLDVLDLRGNVNTRLKRLDDGHYDAILLAVAGLERLGFDARIARRLEPPEWVPAAGQGAIGIECLSDRADVVDAVAALNDAHTNICVRTERAVAEGLAADCQMPIGAYAVHRAGTVELRARVAAVDGRSLLDVQLSGPARDAVALGRRAATELNAQGASTLLAQ